MSGSTQELRVGSRVLDKDDFRGTVCYIGPVATSKSTETIYAGISWDDNTRGRNDGSVVTADGVIHRYFQCTQGAGSFVKAELVKTGTDFLSALRQRYEDDSCSGKVEESSIVGISGHSVPILLVGDEKIRAQQTLRKLTHVSLSSEPVSRILPNSLESICPNVREVDLRGCLISRWGDIVELGKQLPKLQMLNIADNVMEPLTGELAAEYSNTLQGLTSLIVSNCHLSWSSILNLSLLAPNLTELHINNNNLKEFVTHPVTYDVINAEIQYSLPENNHSSASFLPPGRFEHLQTLHMSDNPVSDWGQILAFAHLPQLSTLVLGNTHLTEIWMDKKGALDAKTHAAPVSAPEYFFPALEHLTLSGCCLAHPSSLDALFSFPRLHTLRLAHKDMQWPNGPRSPAEARHTVLARVPSLSYFNGSEVRAHERIEAERHYTRKVAGIFANEAGVNHITDVFGNKNLGLPPIEPPKTTLAAGLPAAFSKGVDSGLIRNKVLEYSFVEGTWSPAYPYSKLSSAPIPVYVDCLDPYQLGEKNLDQAAKLQMLFPRYFLLAARYDVHAESKVHVDSKNLATRSIELTLRSMSGNSCLMEPEKQKLPLSMTVKAVKLLATRLFKADLELLRLSFRDSTTPYPFLLCDDDQPLSYYAITEGGEILIEEVNPNELAKIKQAETQKKQDSIRKQEIQGDRLRMAQETAVARQMDAVVSSASSSRFAQPVTKSDGPITSFADALGDDAI